MRLLIDTLIALMLAAVLGAVLMDHRQDQEQMDRVAAVQQAVRAIQSQALYRAAMREIDQTPNGYARRIDANWFSQPPRNVLVEADGGAYQWLDYAPEGGHEWFDPPRIVAAGDQAAFWYNPHRGLVRARVPMQFTQQETIDLYNLVNGTTLRIADCRWDYHQPGPETRLAAPALPPPPPPVGSARSAAATATKTAAVTAPADPVLRDLAGRKR